MIKKTITYLGCDGVERTEDFYFHLNQKELLDMEMSTSGGLAEKLEAISNAKDGNEVYKLFDDVIRKSYGKKSEDGKRFIKSEDIVNEFIQSEAYSNMFMEFMMDSTKAAEFMNGVIPNIPQIPNA